MFTSVLFITAPNCKQSKCPSVDECINKLVHPCSGVELLKTRNKLQWTLDQHGFELAGSLAWQFFPIINTVLHSLPLDLRCGTMATEEPQIYRVNCKLYMNFSAGQGVGASNSLCCSRFNCIDTHNIYNNSGDEFKCILSERRQT